jgi:hypothetical protein
LINYLGRYGRALLGAIHDAVEIQFDERVEGWDGVRCA